MCWYLCQGRNDTTLARTASTLTRLIYQVGATGLATSLIAVAALVAYIIRPKSFIFIAIHFSLGRMYTNSLLVSLNARVNLQKDDHVVVPANGILVSITRSNIHEYDTITSRQSATIVRPLDTRLEVNL
ncbi:hypothetical protein BDN72DRAFT_503191 [Pluteus cervinus]|uniref:Uncharacterized protein n=1 Tax=Pluteus cervinus TaxID=181527 RepID=A0ACD3AYF6_9AGAR|nr:hypothetical protein BDN72DRAFT_503191 [Pluteus cervinus]